MPSSNIPLPMQGLTQAEVMAARQAHGQNVLFASGNSGFLKILTEVVTEPMFILLTVASIIYFVLGEYQEGTLLLVAIVLVAAISFYQTIKSEQALEKLKKLTQATTKVLREGQLTETPVEELVPGDIILVEEGQAIPADAVILEAHDLTIDEAILTGESVNVTKIPQDAVFAGTHLTSGNLFARVSAIGQQTELGKLGKSLREIEVEKTPLQIQIRQFVQRMAVIGVFAFLLIWGINYWRSGEIIASLLFGLTIAMSILPEEIPVAFSGFMALGAARMTNLGVLTKQPQTVESLGSATVICADKTGTITRDGMTVKKIYDPSSEVMYVCNETTAPLVPALQDILKHAMWASEPVPFDPMEKAIHGTFDQYIKDISKTDYNIFHEYPLAGKPPMMTHVYRGINGETVISGKGGVEKMLEVCKIAGVTGEQIMETARQLSDEGLRVLGVASGALPVGQLPENQEDFHWSFKGLIALLNPPKTNAQAVLDEFYQAGIQVKMITGDYPETAMAVAREIRLKNAGTFLSGWEIMYLAEEALRQRVKDITIFARMFPEAKLRVINALKANGEVVAMTGDGVNDGPALKAAHIGVSMGKRGTEIAKQAASLVLVHDDLQGMVDAIAHGRKIYENLKKAVSYIVSIHIPIILTVAVPLILNWQFANIFSPIHVIFLELVMGPTCSIAFENEPPERNLMRMKPRNPMQSFLSIRELSLSIIQGLVISAAVLTIYHIAIHTSHTMAQVRTMVFVTLVMSNIFLTLTNRSFSFSFIETLRYRNPLLWLMLFLTFLILLVTLYVPAVQQLFSFQKIDNAELLICTLAAFISVFWVEAYKLIRRKF
jgi:Ca2+-transporting ATPase